MSNPQSRTVIERGSEARSNILLGAVVLSDIMGSTLGPNGNDKFLVTVEGKSITKTSITNDGATILRQMAIDNPAGRVLVQTSLAQDTTCGDGTTGVVVLAGTIVKLAQQVINNQDIHPQTVCAGLTHASSKIRRILESLAVAVREDSQEGRRFLFNLAKTTLSSKIVSLELDHFAKLAADAVTALPGSADVGQIPMVVVPGQTIADTSLVPGYLLPRQSHMTLAQEIEDPKILTVNTALDADRVKIANTTATVRSLSAASEIAESERERVRAKCDKLAASGCSVIVNRQLIYNLAYEYLTSKGIVCIEHSDFTGIEQISSAVGSSVVSDFQKPLKPSVLGTCAKISPIMIDDHHFLHFQGCKGLEPMSIVIRGSNLQVCEEVKRSLYDALSAVALGKGDLRFLPGGGATEMHLALALEATIGGIEERLVPGTKVLCDSLVGVAQKLIENANGNSYGGILKLKALHQEGKHYYGVPADEDTFRDMMEMGVVESFKSKVNQVLSAIETAISLLRVDHVIVSEASVSH